MGEPTDPPERSGVPFGFRRVAADDHAAMVRGVFDSVADRYDLMNDLMSGGLHRLWKRALLDRLRQGETLIDVAGGTGDVALGFVARRGGAGATIVDANGEMLRVGRDRAIDRGVAGGIAFVRADAAALPIADRTADAVTIAFGLRNVSRRAEALAEMRRVLAPGGHFLCLEFSRVVVPALARLYDAYSFRVVPLLGRWVTGDEDSYRYLVESIREFPDQETLAGELRDAGFGNVTHTNLSGGIVALHSAWRV
jgi:demethylmenaquinone methyltransferase/2-methoxy-6-polyprenyl-1,4-benzoquinol methylase